jgi:hypothetical protein
MHGQLVPRGQHHFAQSISYIDVNIYFERHHFSFHRGHILCLVDWWLGKLKDGRVVLGPTAMLFLLLSLISIAFAAAAVPAPTQSSTQSQCEVALAAACAGSRGNAFIYRYTRQRAQLASYRQQCAACEPEHDVLWRLDLLAHRPACEVHSNQPTL